MTKEEIVDRYFDAFLRHYQMGCPEADNTLNDACRTAIREYAQLVPEAMCLKTNGENPFFKPTIDEPLYNFCADHVFDAGAGNFEEIKQAVHDWRETHSLDALHRMDDELEKANPIIFVWS